MAEAATRRPIFQEYEYLRRLLPDEPLSLTGYLDAGGYRVLGWAGAEREDALASLLRGDLFGLGGAEFPFGTKLGSALRTAPPRYVVCNCGEDEPGSLKDRTLAARNPHLLVEGALIAATILEAEVVFFYVNERFPDAVAAIEKAIDEIRTARQPVLAHLPELRLVRAPNEYVAGEASAALEFIEGRKALPRKQPPYPTESGLWGKATLVSNAETLANLPRLVGPAASSAPPPVDGRPRLSAFTRLATVGGDVCSPEVIEIDPTRTTLRDLITRAGGVLNGRDIKAVQPGGPSSIYVAEDSLDRPLNRDSFLAEEGRLGCLAVRVISEGHCIVEDLLEVSRFFAKEQCGQCPACRMKTQAYTAILDQVVRGKGNWKLIDQFPELDEFAGGMATLCALVDMPTPPVRSALRLFRRDFAAHIDSRVCAYAT
jgi:NADH-quinone oxidoreductase subunit F